MRGLSLFEMLVVLSVMFVLVIAVMLSYPHLVISTKISRVKEEHTSLVRALTNYHVDYDRYPPTHMGLSALSAPTAYLGAVPIDPFTSPEERKAYFYLEEPINDLSFILISNGPDGDNDLFKAFEQSTQMTASTLQSSTAPSPQPPTFDTILRTYLEKKIYDPTNGLSSDGDLIYVGKK